MTPTPKQAAWINRVQKALSSKGGEGLGFYTIGDSDVTIYDLTKRKEIIAAQDRGINGQEFCHAVQYCEAEIDRLFFPSQVESTCG